MQQVEGKTAPPEARNNYATEEKVLPFKYPPADIFKVTYIEPLGARSTGPDSLHPTLTEESKLVINDFFMS